MPSILVSDLPTASEIHQDFDLVVSLLDCGEDETKYFGRIDQSKHLVLHFDDVDGNYPNCPMACHLEMVFDFLESKIREDSRILVHCHAGISRSTAMAIAILIRFFNKDPMSAINIIFGQRREVMWPNRRIIKLADHMLDLRGELKRADQRWRKIHLHPRLRLFNTENID